MKSAAVSRLKASLSEYLAKVKKGEEVVVTDRGHPVAKLVPFSSCGPIASEREKLARDGILELGRTGKIPQDCLKPSEAKDPSGVVLRALLKERAEGV